MKNFLYLFISRCGTFNNNITAYLVAFSNKKAKVNLENVDILSAEEIGQMMGGN